MPTNLPGSRSYTLVPGSSEVPASVINELQDCIVGNKKPTMWRTGFPITNGYGSWVAGSGNALISTAGGVVGAIALPCEEGDRVTNFDLYVTGNGTADATFDLYMGSLLTTTTNIGTLTLTNQPGPAWAKVSIPVAPRVLDPDSFLYLAMLPTGAGFYIGGWRLGYDRLL